VKNVFAFVFALVLAAPTGQTAEDAWRTDPTAFINHFAQVGISDILNADVPVDEKTARFRELFTDAFDIPAVSRFVLARSWRAADDAERDEFVGLFEDVIVYTWSRRFGEYEGQTIEVRSTAPDGETGVVVDSAIVDKTGQSISVQWRLRQRDTGLKIVDVVVEGVSMAITYRQDYASVIRQNGGLAGLMAELRKQIEATKPA
jgi:phospholipid transport system substrate-binding protein